MPVDLLHRVPVNPQIRQRARNQRQSPAPEDHPQIQAVEGLHPIHLLGVTTPPRRPQIPQSPQARRPIGTPRRRVRTHVLTPAAQTACQLGSAAADRPARSPDARAIRRMPSYSAAATSIAADVRRRSWLSGTVAIRSRIVVPVSPYAASELGAW